MIALVLKSYQLGVGSRSGGIQGVFSPEEPVLILAAEELRKSEHHNPTAERMPPTPPTAQPSHPIHWLLGST